MQGRKAMLILHGKQAMNEEVRGAVRGLRDSGWVLDVRVTWEAGDAQRLVTEALAAGYSHIVAGVGTARRAMSPRPWGWRVPRPAWRCCRWARPTTLPRPPASPGDRHGAGLAQRSCAADRPGAGRRAVVPQHGHRRFWQPGHGQHLRRPEESPGRCRLPVHRAIALQRTAGRFGGVAGARFSLARDLLALGIGNGRQAGGGQVLCPEAVVNDGLLDIAILPAPQEVVGTLRDLLAGDGLFVRARLPWVEIKCSQGLDINLDGEPLQADKLRFQARAAALRLHLPAGSPLLSRPG